MLIVLPGPEIRWVSSGVTPARLIGAVLCSTASDGALVVQPALTMLMPGAQSDDDRITSRVKRLVEVIVFFARSACPVVCPTGTIRTIDVTGTKPNSFI